MTDVLLATDAQWVYDEIVAALEDPETTIRWVRRGADVLAAVEEQPPDVAILDLQIGSMGGMAVCLSLRLEESADRLPHVPVIMLLDRVADVFLARRSQAEGWLIKPIDPIRLQRAVRTVLDDGTYTESLPGLPGDPDPAPAGESPATVG